ncbi:MAG: alginate lyase family protein [Oceanospirillales bacterium]|nr:alginate lyase family protein [Oceanospirillales bacterium]
MGPHEIIHRIKEAALRSNGRKKRGWSEFELPEMPLPIIPFDSCKLDDLGKILEHDWSEIFEHSTKAEWTWLGSTWPGKPEQNIWINDPITEKDWPNETYCFDVPFRHVKDLGDVKYVWEVNRLQFLPPIAALSRIKGNDDAKKYCLTTIESWIDSNPPFKGINWASGIELALRSISILLSISLIGADEVPPKLAEKICKALHAHAYWIDRFPSKYSSANNHLIAEAAALYILGTTMPALPKASHYREKGLKILADESVKQFFEDGVGGEQSPTYTAFSAEFYLLSLFVAKSVGDTVPPSTLDRLGKVAQHLRWITDSAGNQPHIGDDDEGRVICSSPHLEKHYVSSILSGLSAATNQPECNPPQRTPHLRDLFFGPIPGTNQEDPIGLNVFDSGGYSVFRNRFGDQNALLVFDHGPLGYLSIAAHGHADALAIWLHIDGSPIIIDAGTYLYHSGGNVRDYFRGTSAHNTLTLNDEDQSTISGAFNWSHKANAGQVTSPAGGNGQSVVAQHSGYQTRFGLIHRREVKWESSKKFTISDLLVGTPTSPNINAKIRFFLAPSISISKTSENNYELLLDGKQIVKMKIKLGTKQPKITVERKDISKQFGEKSSTNVLCIEYQDLDMECVTQFEFI